MATSRAWGGWIGFAGLTMLIIGIVDFFEGLIAVARDNYFAVAGNQLIVFDTSTWGWITMVLGVGLLLVGLGLTTGAGWSRWAAIVILVVNLVEQLAWLGSTSYPLWTLTVIALEILVLYALTVRWEGASEL